MITATPPRAAMANLQTAPAASGPVELRAGNADDGRLGAFPRALQGSVDEPDPGPAKPARPVAAQRARREGQADASVGAAGAPGAAGDDAGKLLAELNARHALRTKIAPQGPSPTPPASGRQPPLVAPRPLVPSPGDVVLPPSEGDDPMLPPPFHDQPGAPMPRDTAADAGAAPAARRWASTSTTAPLHGLSATTPAATSKPPLGGPQPAVPRPRSHADQDALQPLPAPGDIVAPPADGDGPVFTRPFHDQPGVPMPRDTAAEAAQAVSGPVEIHAPDPGAGLDTTPQSSLKGEGVSVPGNRTATELTAGQQVSGQPMAPGVPSAAAQPPPWSGPGQATASGNDGHRVMAADGDTARPADEGGSTPFALPLPMGQALAPAGMSAASATGTTAEARLTAAPGSADFSSQLGAQLTTFVREGVQHARLHLHPAELGPVTVRIQIDGQAAQVHMAAEHALTRQALEQSMPMLAGSLREAGLTLSGGGVFEQPRQREGGDAPGQRDAGTANARGSERSPETPRHAPTGAPARRGVVDLVA